VNCDNRRKGRMWILAGNSETRACFRSFEVGACEQAQIQVFVEAKRSDLRNGLTRRQRTFILEKMVGLNDKDAALAAGYSLSVAENTKQRIWKPQVRAEYERVRRLVKESG
jgi:hypothetical protein